MPKHSACSRPVYGPPDPRSLTREAAQTRAREIAQQAGRGAADVSQADYEQAKRQLTGTSDPLRQEELLTPPVAPTE